MKYCNIPKQSPFKASAYLCSVFKCLDKHSLDFLTQISSDDGQCEGEIGKYILVLLVNRKQVANADEPF